MLFKRSAILIFSIYVGAFLTLSGIGNFQSNPEISKYFNQKSNSNHKSFSKIDSATLPLFKLEFESEETRHRSVDNISVVDLNFDLNLSLQNSFAFKDWVKGHKSSSFIGFLSLFSMSPPRQS